MTRSERREVKEKERGRERREEGFYRSLMLFHPLPLFCARNTKNLTFPSSASLPRFSRVSSPPPLTLTLQSFLVLRPFFLLRFSSNIPMEPNGATFLVTSFYNLIPANDGALTEYRLFRRDKFYFFPKLRTDLLFSICLFLFLF